jgi:MinD superfamily P-loop ATPase
MLVSIASGKGGSGKTTVALNLARTLGKKAEVLDCDVEAPNAHIFLRGDVLSVTAFSVPVPEWNEGLCTSCGKCAQVCQFNAIAMVGNKPMLFPELCHSCTACIELCPAGAYTQVMQKAGDILCADIADQKLTQGRLQVGMPAAPRLIEQVIRQADSSKFSIIDTSPGTGCAAVAGVRHAQVVVLVAEPTPFGLNDLELSVAMVREMKIPFGVVINRKGIGDERVHHYCASEGIPIWAELEDDRRVAEAYSRGELMVDAFPAHFRPVYTQLYNCICEAASLDMRI